MSCSKQTFVSRANNALVEAGFDYRMVFTRGEYADAELDRPVSTESSYRLKPRKTDLIHFPRVVQGAIASNQTCRFLFSTVRLDLGRRLAISSAVVNYRVLKDTQQWNPDLIVTHFLWNLKVAIEFANALDIPVMCVAHGSDVMIDKTWLEHVMHPRVSRIFCVSHAIKKKIDETFPLLAEKTVVLYTPISSLYLEEVRPVDEKGIKVACVAALRDLKNHAWLFRALRVLKEAKIPFECKLIGEPLSHNPQYRNVLRDLVRELELEDDCAFLGWLTPVETKQVIDDSTVLVLPSRSEGLPTVIIESIARQRCPVGTDIPAIREGMLDGEYGILCPLDDDVALSKAINEAHQRTVAKPSDMAAGREKIAELFSPKRYADLFLNHVNEVLGLAKN